MTGLLPRLFGKSQYPGETRKMMHEMNDYKTSQRTAKLESELKASKDKVEELQGKLEAMKIVLEKKDSALDDITRDREKVALELKNQDYCNKFMKQQLEKDRKALEKDTQRFIIEKSNFQTKKQLMLGQITIQDLEQYPTTLEGCSREISRLQSYTQFLQTTLLEREKTISSLCEKFLLLKYKKTQGLSQLKSLKDEFDEISKDLLGKLEDARNEINMIADTKFQDPMDKKIYALTQMVQKNGELILENSTLKLEISQLKQSVTSLKLENSAVDINTRTLEMTSVPSGYTMKKTGRKNCSFTYSTKSSEITNSQSNTYGRSWKTVSNIPTRSYNSCCSTPRSAPSSIFTNKPKSGNNPLYATQETEVDTSKIHQTAPEKRDYSLKSHKINKESKNEPGEYHDNFERRRVKQSSYRFQDRRRNSRRNKEARQYTSDSSGRDSLPSRPSEVRNIPSQLLAELHPSVPECNSKESVACEKVRRRERHRNKVKSVRYNDREPLITRRQDETAVKEIESVDSIYSAYLVHQSPTRSTPGRVETTAFVQGTSVNNKIVPNMNVQERSKYVNTKCN